MLMLEPSAEAVEFAGEVRRMLRTSWPLSQTRHAIDAGEEDNPTSWKALVGLGAAGLLVPDEQGGAGAGLDTTVLLATELGRVLLPGPFWSTAVLAAATLAHLGTPEAAGLLRGIAGGSTTATVALFDGTAGGNAPQPTVEAHAFGASWRLRGDSPFVTDAACATVILVPARMGNTIGLFAVTKGAASVERLVCMDRTRPLSRVSYDGTPATLVASGDAVRSATAHAVALGTVTLLAEGVGAADQCLTLTTDYAKTRVQFGRAIGSYQAIKHRCADMFIRIESVRSAVHHAAAVLEHQDSTPEDVALAVDTALAFGTPKLLQCAGDTIQIHGGIGFTWEHDAHLYFKRAQADAQLLGSADQHRARIATRLGVLKEGTAWT